jgi:hypothetical protein
MRITVVEEPFLLVHRDELLNLQERGFKQRNTDEIVRSRVEISYSPELPPKEKILQVYVYPYRHAST